MPATTVLNNTLNSNLILLILDVDTGVWFPSANFKFQSDSINTWAGNSSQRYVWSLNSNLILLIRKLQSIRRQCHFWTLNSNLILLIQRFLSVLLPEWISLNSNLILLIRRLSEWQSPSFWPLNSNLILLILLPIHHALLADSSLNSNLILLIRSPCLTLVPSNALL